MKKNYLIDTNVLLHDPAGALFAFEDNDVYLPIRAIEEVDKKKHSPELGFHAREVSRHLDTLFEGRDVSLGAPTPGGGRLFVDLNGDDVNSLPDFLEKTTDNMILMAAKRLASKLGGIILVSKDTNLRLKAGQMGIKAEDYRFDKTDPTSILHTGLADIDVSEGVIHSFSAANDELDATNEGIPQDVVNSLLHNTCCCLRAGQPHHFVLAIYNQEKGSFKYVLKPARRDKGHGAVFPRNNEQCFAYDLVSNPEIELVTFLGGAGTGKTMIGLLAALDQLEAGQYERIVVCRPTEEVGKPMGFLPGTLEEKFGPHAAPIISRLRLIERGRKHFKIEEWLRTGKIDIRPINYIRGDTVDNAVIVVDESQNFRPLDAKTIISRAGQNTKVVLNGDPGQIDAPYLDPLTNGLVHVVSRYKGRPRYAHLKLVKGERSRLAEEAARIL